MCGVFELQRDFFANTKSLNTMLQILSDKVDYKTEKEYSSQWSDNTYNGVTEIYRW